MNFEMAMLAMQAAQYIKAIEGFHVSTSIHVECGRLSLSIYSNLSYAQNLPDGYLFSEREFKCIGVIDNERTFVTTYYFNF